MGFQQPPTLPDYSKLTFKLNNSGVQSWNPAVYDILKELISAVQKSQDTLVDSTIPDIISGISSTVLVDPAGAILGDGSSGSPLRTNPDLSTISIIANQLVANGAVKLSPVFTISNAQILAGTELDGVVTSGGGTDIIVPLWAIAYIKIDLLKGYTTSRSLSLRYSQTVGGGGGSSQNDILGWAGIIPSGIAANERWHIAPLTNDFYDATTLNGNPEGKSIYVVFSGSNTSGDASNILKLRVAYTILPGIK